MPLQRAQPSTTKSSSASDDLRKRLPYRSWLDEEPLWAGVLGLQAEIAGQRRWRDLRAMRDNTSSQLSDMGSLRLERAIRRFEKQDHEGGLEDLRAALDHMRWAGADPLSVQHLASIITAAEQEGGLALQISNKRGKSR